MSGEIESKQQDTEEGQITARWLRELSLAAAHEKKWRERAEKVIKRYRDEEADENRSARFNILYANTEVLRGVMYQRSPVPDVRRRFADRDPVGREAAQVLQRALSYTIEQTDFDGMMAGVVEDVLLPGRGMARCRYVPKFGPMIGADGRPVLDEAGKPMQQVVSESVETDYIEWDMVRISPAKRWSKVRWVAFGELLTRDELVEQFGDVGKACALDWSPKDKEQDDDLFKRALVWSIWDKATRKVHVVSKGSERRLAVIDDPLNLEGFFPCPPPIYAISTTGTMIPIPEFTQYQDQAIELDTLTARIDALTSALRRRGLYNGSYPEIAKLASAGDNEFIPVEKYSELIEKGIESAIWEAPIEMLAKVIVHLMQQREAVKQTIYEITGIADVVRGVSQASETLGAQELKARYANSRVGPRQKAVQTFARNLMRIGAEIIAEKFAPQTLAQMTGIDLAMDDAEKQALAVQAEAAKASGAPAPAAGKLKKPTWEQVMQILRDDKLRGFHIDVETDSTVQPDAAEEQKNRIELLSAITQFVQGIAPAVQSGAVPMDLAKEMLSFGVRAFRVSPQMEDALDQIGQQDDDKAAESKQQIQAMVKQAQEQIQQQRAEAEGVIVKAKDAQHRADMDALRVEYEGKFQKLLADTGARDATEAGQYAREAMQAVQSMIAEFRAELEQARAEVDPTYRQERQAELTRMEQMQQQTLAIVNDMVRRLSAPRVLEKDPRTGKKVVVVVEEGA